MSPVFDEAKYRALLEKLEVSEVKISDIDESLRIDSSFYTGILCRYSKKISSITHTYFRNEIFKASKGIFDIKADQYCSVGIPFVRIGNLTNMQIDLSEIIYIPIEINAIHKTSALSFGDIIISKTAIPAASIVTLPQCNTSQDTIAIQLKKEATINSFYTVAYLNSRYGLALMENLFTGNIQKHFNLSDCKDKLPIPIFSTKLQNAIKVDMENGINRNERAKAVYIEAEQLLLQELGLMNWQPDDESVATKTFADFQNSGRLDAEYYQPKYDDLFKRISSYDKSRLGDIVNITKSIEPGSEAYQEDGVPFVRVSDITKFGITPPEIHLDRAEYYSEDLIPKKNTILLSKDGSVGIAYKVENDLDVITSGALLHLTVKNNDFLPDYLTLVLNSIVVKLQAERDAGGSIIQHWKPSEIENVIIPKLPMPTQEQIAAKVQESFALRRESKRLLELAKHAVEVAIEQGEDVAIKLLEI